MFSSRSLTVFSLLASSIASAHASRFSNTTSTAPKDFVVGPAGAFKYAGCASSATAFDGWTLALDSEAMTIELCASIVPAGTAVFGTSFDKCLYDLKRDNTTAIVDADSCSFVCPGDETEFCGGELSASPAKRAFPGLLLSLYQPIFNVIPPTVYVTIIIEPFVGLCSNGLCTKQYTETQTLTHCGCTDKTPSATIAYTTSVGACACGPGASWVTQTVTVPVGLVAGTASASLGGGSYAAFTGAAVANGVHFGAAAGVVAVAVAML